MSVGSLIFLLLIVGSFLAMFSMHRGGHAHGGGGCGGHGGHGNEDEQQSTDHAGHEQHKPLLGPPGTQSTQPAPAPAQGHRHGGC